MRRVPLLVVLLALAGPLAGATTYLQGTSPVAYAVPGNPQFYCAVVFDAPGEQFCRVEGRVAQVDYVRIRIVGQAQVHVSVIDESGPLGLPEQRAVVTCTQTCQVPLLGAPHSDAKWSMWVWATAYGPAAFTEASLESRVPLRTGADV